MPKQRKLFASQFKVPAPTMQEMVDAVSAHSIEHYQDGGWDVVVECWEKKDIAEAIEGATSIKQAIAMVADAVDVYAERQADARNSAF